MNKKREIAKLLIVSGLAILAIVILWYFRGKDIEKHRREFPQMMTFGEVQVEILPCHKFSNSQFKFRGIYSNDIFIGGCCPDECALP